MADTIKYYHNLDVVNNKVMNLLLNPLTTSQRNTVGGTLGVNEEGYVCFDTTLNQQYFWDGTQWIVVGGGSGTLVALPFTTDHLAATNNQYVIGDLVWYLGDVYRCIANNDSLTPSTSPLYWTNLGAGFPLVQQPADWNSTSGNNQILNKPTIPTGTVTGSGTVDYITKWTPTGTALGDSSIQDSAIGIVATNSITAASGVAKSVNLTSTLTAAANNDLLSALDINTTFTGGSFTGLTKRLFRATADTILRTELRDSGIQSWYLNDGAAEVGLLGFSTPNSHPGIVMFNASLTGRSDIRHQTNGGFTIATHAAGTIPLVDQFYFNPSGNLGIGTTNDTYRLEVLNTATPAANYARFANDNNNKNAILFSTSTSAAISLTGPSAERKLLIGNGGTGRADFITYQDNYFNFSYSSALGGAQLPASLFKFTPNFTYSTGTNSHTILDIFPNISITGGTNTLRGVYYNPNNTAGTATTEIAWENTQGDIIHGNLATGGADEMVTVDTNGKLKKQTIPSGGGGTVTSVDLTMPSAFTVTGNPVTTSGTLAVSGAGTVSQYVRGDGTLANFPNSTGGGASVNYYLNGSVSQGTFGGDTFYQMSKTPVLGAGTNFTRTNGAGNGYIASFITDAGDPSQLNIPGGNWNLEFYFASSSSGGTPQFYGEVYKVSATNVFTLIASGSANPEGITNGTTVDQYFTSISVPQTTLLITDRLAIRIYVITGGRTITLHTENSNLCEVLTTFTTGLTALNGLTEQVQNFATGTSGTDFGISSASATHTFNLPTASATNRGALSSADWTIFNGKQNSRSVNVVSTATAAGSTAGTDYVYLVSGTTTITLPTAVGNTNRYTIKRSGTGVVSIATTSSQTIDGSSSPITINVQYVSLDFISDGTNWEII
jgi:hypothetical protein